MSYFGDVANDGVEQNLPHVQEFFAIRKKIRTYVTQKDRQGVIRELNKYKTYIEPELQD